MSEIQMIYDRELHEECGVFGVFNLGNAAELTYYGLHALQHRGQEGAGIVVSDKGKLTGMKNEGSVRYVFPESALKKLVGNLSIGHVRYSTTGGGGILNVQPFLFRHGEGDFALCHNGNIVNSKELRRTLEMKGSIFQSSSDSEILAHLIKKDYRVKKLEAIKEALIYLEGAFAFLLLTDDKLYAMRDRHGLRPLSIGKLEEGYVVTSETCALDAVGATFVRDILPGEIVTFDSEGMHSDFYSHDTEAKICAMEYIYFSRPDSDLLGLNVHRSRKECGRILAKEAYIDADIVIGVPDSSLSAASGYAEASGIPYEMGLIKNRYIGRTFIEPSQALREKGVKMKLSPVRSVIAGKRVILIDDSIVRGTTSMKIVEMLRQMGAAEIHMRVASPQIIAPCFYGVDTSTYEELISAFNNVEEVRKIIGADTLAFLSMDGLRQALGSRELCVACFSKDYPTHLYDQLENANKDGKF
jgi:amidophosphoribosyltransferase